MSTTLTWAIANLNREISDGFVVTAYYNVNITDGTYSSSAFGSVNFERPDVLVPFDDLTSEIVSGWVKEAIGSEKVDRIEAALRAKLDEKNVPTKAYGVPWPQLSFINNPFVMADNL